MSGNDVNIASTTNRGSAVMIVAAAALIDAAGLVLVQQRPQGKAMAGLWEFPGGKVEPGETPEAALVRELDEELGIDVDPSAFTPITFASAPAGDQHMLLLLYLARDWTGEARAIEAAAIRWVDIEALRELPMPPADGPLIDPLAALI